MSDDISKVVYFWVERVNSDGTACRSFRYYGATATEGSWIKQVIAGFPKAAAERAVLEWSGEEMGHLSFPVEVVVTPGAGVVKQRQRFSVGKTVEVHYIATAKEN